MKLSGHKIQAISQVGAPTISISTYTNTSITIAWTNRTEPLISYYAVYYSTSQNGTYTKANNANNTTTGPYLISGLTQGLTYYIYIRAVDSSGNLGPASNIVSQALTTFNIPNISFTQGQSSNHNLSQYYTIPPGQSFVSLSVVQGNLESDTSGLTLNSGAQTLIYDGVGLPATKSGLVIRLTTNVGTIDSTSFSVTVNPAQESLTWISDPFPMTIVRGSEVDLRPYYSDSQSELDSIVSVGTQFPSGVTLESSPYWRIVAASNATLGTSGGGHQLRLIDSAEADWIARSTASGVLYATDFRSASDFVSASSSSGGRGKWGADYDGGQAQNESYIVQDTTDGITGGACLRIDVPTGKSNSSAWICSMNPAWTAKTQGMGSTRFYIQHRLKIPASRLVPQPGTHFGGPYSAGWKWMNLAGYDPTDPRNGSRSNLNFEHVMENTQWNNYPFAYRRDAVGSYVGFDIPFGGSDFRRQSALDNGLALPNNLRYCLYSDPSGCWMFEADEWITLDYEIRIQTYGGSTGNEFHMWATRPGGTKTKLFQNTGYSCGSTSDGFTGGFNGIWLLAYETNASVPGNVTHQKYDQLIISTSQIATPVI